MGDPAGAAEVRAAGAVLWRPGPGVRGVEVAIVHRPRYDDWAFPKGKATPGEHPLLTAVREVTEETGLRPVLGRRLPPMFYLAAGRPKRVDYWAATLAAPQAREHIPNGGAGSRAQATLAPPAQGEPAQAELAQAELAQAELAQAELAQGELAQGELAQGELAQGELAQGELAQGELAQGELAQAELAQAEFVPNDEVDKLEWLPVAEAAQRLSYERDVGLLREFASAPVPTVPYIFLRHASAVPKQGWRGDGVLRPLDEAGRADATALARLLACFGLARVFSSASARCVETVLPYSVHVGVPAVAEPAFTVFPPGGMAAARTRLGELLADGLPMILCGHGETLPPLYAQAVTYFGAAPPADVSLDKGSFSVLHVAGAPPAAGAGGAPSLVATERHGVIAP